MPKATTPVSKPRQERRHNPLDEDLTATETLKIKGEKRKSRHQDEGDQFVDSKASRKILRMGQELADEDTAENSVQPASTAFDFESRLEDDGDEEPAQEYEEWGDEEVEEIELAPGDLETFNKFFPTEEDPLLKQGWPGVNDSVEDEGPGTNLADLILEKIAMHEAAGGESSGNFGAPDPIDEDFEIPPKVVEVYTKYVHSLKVQKKY